MSKEIFTQVINLPKSEVRRFYFFAGLNLGLNKH